MWALPKFKLTLAMGVPASQIVTPVGNLMTSIPTLFGLATCRAYWDSMGFPEMGDPQFFFAIDGSFYAITVSFLGPPIWGTPRFGETCRETEGDWDEGIFTGWTQIL